jgi:hypothetical protein
MPFTETPTAFTWDNLNPTWASLDSLWARGVFVQLGVLKGFKLDDFVLGVIGENRLDGEVDYRNVTDNVFSISVNRGRSRDLERTNAGTLGVQLRNQSRRFDPLNADSDLDGYIEPKKPIRVLINGLPVFAGLSDDWNFDYSVGGDSVASVSATDGFAAFARQINANVPVPQQSSGERINAVLNQSVVGWPQNKRDIDTGDTVLAAGVLEDNVLSYLNFVEQSEFGFIFMTKDGDFAFKSRLVGAVSTATTFSDAGSDIPYQDIQLSFGSELLVNRTTITSTAGTAVAENVASIVNYGSTENDVETLLSSTLQLQALADYIVAKFGNPEFRVENITVNLRTLSDDQIQECLDLELGDQANVIFTPNNIGAPIAVRGRILGISHSLTPDSHNISIAFESLPFQFFTINDPVFGRLDNIDGVLAF